MLANKLPTELTKFDFNEVFKCKPNNNTVLVYNKELKKHEEKVIFRNYDCHLTVPEFDSSIEKSFMFINKKNPVPEPLLPLVNFVQNLDKRYNNLVINYYEPDDYIELHSDCTSRFLEKNSPILSINLNETDSIYSIRSMILKDKETGEFSSFPLLNNHYYVITNNTTHRHAVGKGAERRISMTFRMLR